MKEISLEINNENMISIAQNNIQQDDLFSEEKTAKNIKKNEFNEYHNIKDTKQNNNSETRYIYNTSVMSEDDVTNETLNIFNYNIGGLQHKMAYQDVDKSHVKDYSNQLTQL